MTQPNLSQARDFILANARLLDRHLFAFHFENAPARAVLAALLGYRHDSGLYAYGLEPDKRSAAPQPIDQATAMQVLTEIQADKAHFETICDGLDQLTAPDGGLPFSYPTVRDAPRAPWWDCAGAQPGSINPTGIILSYLWQNGVSHPWMQRAEAFCWAALETLAPNSAHSVETALAFLAHAPDRARADAALAGLAPVVRGAVSFDPDATGYVFSPLTLAPMPTSPAARFFTDAEIAPHLQKMVDTQQEDGGWPINWPPISPGVEAECRSIVTLRNLRTLRAYGVG